MARTALFLLALLVPSVARGAEPAVPITQTFDIDYATIGSEKLRLDLAAPKGGGPHPCVVLFHGGAWKSGSRRDLSRPGLDIGTPGKAMTEVLASRGYAAVSVGYRFAPRNKFPAQIQDAKTAVRYLRAHAKELNIDAERIAAMGFSAGGHLAALLGTTGDVPEFEGNLYPEQSSRVRCVVDFFGPSDLSLYAETPGIENAFFVPLLGKKQADRPDLYKQASPVTHVCKDCPPFLLVHGTIDLIVPAVHSERLHEKLLAAGVKSELICVPGAGHGWGGEAAARTLDAAVRFLDAELKADGPQDEK
jgi:acetyl esterase/lipase